MWWKIYFWIYTVIMVLGIIGLFSVLSSFAFVDIVSYILNIVLYVGLYGYVFKKRILEPKWWSIVFWINAVGWTLSIVDWFLLNRQLENALPFLKSGLSLSSGDLLFAVLSSLPALYAVRLLASSKKK